MEDLKESIDLVELNKDASEKELSEFLSMTLPKLDTFSRICRSVARENAVSYAETDDKSFKDIYFKWKNRASLYDQALDVLSQDPLIAKV